MTKYNMPKFTGQETLAITEHCCKFVD